MFYKVDANMNYIINLSSKKSGTSTVYELLRKNFPASSQKEFFIPPIKEYYLIPRPAELFFSLESTIQEQYKKEIDKVCNSEKKFLLKLASESTREKLNLLFLTFRSRNHKLLTHVCLNRFEKIFEGTDHRQCLLSDNNFFEDFIATFTQDTFAYFLEIFDKKKANRYFALYRNPIDTTISLARMVYYDSGWNPYSKEQSVLAWAQENFLRTCVVHNLRYSFLKHTNAQIHVFDFAYFIRNQKEFVSLFCEKFDINEPRKIEAIGNVNPKASWLKKNKFWDKNIEKILRNYLVSQVKLSQELRMEMLLHEIISEKKYAILDKSTFTEF